MNRWLNAALCPPCTVVDCGCAGGCSAPIGVLYISGIFAIVYGLFFGGPLGSAGISWGTVMLGIALWGIAAAWAALLILRYQEQCTAPQAPSSNDESRPFDEVKKAKSG